VENMKNSNIQYFENNLKSTKGYKFERRAAILLAIFLMVSGIIASVVIYCYLVPRLHKNISIGEYLGHALFILFTITLLVVGGFTLATIKCEKIGFGEDGVYIIHRLNKYLNRPLFIPYCDIIKLYYCFGTQYFLFSHKSKLVSESIYCGRLTRENIQRLREKLKVLKEIGKWNGDLNIYALDDEEGKYVGPKLRVYQMDEKENEKKDEG
jgi:hypothetical protein